MARSLRVGCSWTLQTLLCTFLRARNDPARFVGLVGRDHPRFQVRVPARAERPELFLDGVGVAG